MAKAKVAGLVAAFTCAVLVAGCPKSEFDPKAGAQEAATSAALEALGPAGDAVQVIKDSPEIARTGLVAHFKRRAQEASMEGDWDQVDWYQAHVDCLGGNCGELTRLQNARRAAARRTAGAARPGATPLRQPARSTAPAAPPRSGTAMPPFIDRIGDGGNGGGGGGGGGGH